MEINVKLAIIILVFFFVLFPSLMLVILFLKKKALKIAGIISFIVYCILLSFLVFGSVKIKDDIVTVTLQKNADWFSMSFLLANFGKTNIFYNLVMLFPIGAFVLSQTQKKTLLKTLLTALLVSVIIEFLQFALPVNRTTELFDIVLNTLSGVIGYAYFYLLLKVFKKM